MKAPGEDAVRMVQFQTPQILPEEVTFEGSLGKGSFGEVFSGICRGQAVAVKVLNKQKLDEKSQKEFEREIILIRYACSSHLSKALSLLLQQVHASQYRPVHGSVPCPPKAHDCYRAPPSWRLGRPSRGHQYNSYYANSHQNGQGRCTWHELVSA